MLHLTRSVFLEDLSKGGARKPQVSSTVNFWISYTAVFQKMTYQSQLGIYLKWRAWYFRDWLAVWALKNTSQLDNGIFKKACFHLNTIPLRWHKKGACSYGKGSKVIVAGWNRLFLGVSELQGGAGMEFFLVHCTISCIMAQRRTLPLAFLIVEDCFVHHNC